MTSKTIPLSAISIQGAKPTTKFGALASMPLSSTARMLARASFAGIPTNAVVSFAQLRMAQYTAWPGGGTRTAKVRSNSSAWSTSTTWNARPTNAGTYEVDNTRSAPAAGSLWAFDITSMVQAWVSGALVNNGLLVFSDETTAGSLRGSTSSSGVPVIVVTYDVPAAAPTALHPSGGAVSLAKPTLLFQAPADTASIQVQVDAAADAVTPDWDSLEVVSSAGLLDLATTDVTYAGLADGATTQWRARVKNPLGWSAWSAWVSFPRHVWGTLTITSPSDPSEDPSPVIGWTYSGVQTAWHAFMRTPTGTLVADSRWTAGDDDAYATGKSVGTAGTVWVQVRDDVDREATPGDPDQLQVSLPFAVVPSGAPDPMLNLQAWQDAVRPWVNLMATRDEIPDEVVVYRDNVLIARLPGADCFTGDAFTFTDTTAPMNTRVSYKLHAVVNGHWSNASATSSIIPTCSGIWLLDTEDDSEALLLGQDDADQSQPEISIVHTPITGGDEEMEVVRRRLTRYPRQGAVTGVLVDALGVEAADTEAVLRGWVEQDAGHLYRLVLGNQNDLVILGDITFTEVPGNNADTRQLGVAANWWKRAV